MMTLKKVLEYVSAEPFRPFRVHMTSGRSFVVRHPEMVYLGKTTMKIVTWLADEEDGLSADREEDVSLLLVESIEPLNGSSGNDRRDA